MVVFTRKSHQQNFPFFLLGQQLPCGSTPIQQSRVIGGQDAKPGAWPWQVLSPFFLLLYSLQIDCIIPLA